MIINKKEKFQEVSPSEGYLLYLDGEIYEGLCCPLNVNPSEIYEEITKKEAEALINIEENYGEDEENGNYS